MHSNKFFVLTLCRVRWQCDTNATSEIHCLTEYHSSLNHILSLFVCLGKCVKFQKRPLSTSDSSLFKNSTNNRRIGGSATPTQKPLRERIIHLLALKPYRKPELLLWLEREKADPKDKAELGTILDEVNRQIMCTVCMHRCLSMNIHVQTLTCMLNWFAHSGSYTSKKTLRTLLACVCTRAH